MSRDPRDIYGVHTAYMPNGGVMVSGRRPDESEARRRRGTVDVLRDRGAEFFAGGYMRPGYDTGRHGY